MIITNLQTRDLFDHERLFQALTPDVVNNSLNAALLYNKETKETSIVMKDSLAAMKLVLKCAVEEAEKDLGIFFEFSKLMYILRNYTEEDLLDLKIRAEYDAEKESSKFIITCKSDRLALPHMIMTETQLDDYVTLDFSMQPREHSVSWDLMDDNKRRDFSAGLNNAFIFLDTDEKKNNAVAVYNNKIVANDVKQVFVWNLDEELDITNWVPIHKKIVRIASSLMNSGLLTVFNVDENLAYLATESAMCKMNNAVSNIAPPSEEDLKKISSDTYRTDLILSEMYQTSKFFSGFYTTNTMNPLKLEMTKDQITYVLQDSGLADFGACNIERKTWCQSDLDYAELTIVNNSLNSFLGVVAPLVESNASIMMQADPNKPAVHLSVDKAEIYLARLK